MRKSIEQLPWEPTLNRVKRPYLMAQNSSSNMSLGSLGSLSNSALITRISGEDTAMEPTLSPTSRPPKQPKQAPRLLYIK